MFYLQLAAPLFLPASELHDATGAIAYHSYGLGILRAFKILFQQLAGYFRNFPLIGAAETAADVFSGRRHVVPRTSLQSSWYSRDFKPPAERRRSMGGHTF